MANAASPFDSNLLLSNLPEPDVDPSKVNDFSSVGNQPAAPSALTINCF